MKTMRFLAMFMLAATMIFASCGKDEPEPTPTPTPTPTPGSSELVLNGTGWEASITNTANMMGVSMNIDMLNTMDFLSDSTGEMFTDFTMEVPDYPALNQSESSTEQFTYTFDGTTLVLTSTGEGSEPGDMGTMTYNATDNTFSMEIPDETYEGINLRDVLGIDKMTFHKVR